jgi:Ca-activated chloride channel family protein
VNDFHFIRPLLLLLIPFGLAVIALLWKRNSNSSNWLQVCDPELVESLLSTNTTSNKLIPYSALALAWLISVCAIAGPSWEKLPQPMHNGWDGRVIIFDLSKSMDSRDVKPSRLERAKYKLIDLISAQPGKQQGLVVFAGDTFTVSPITDDADTLINLVPSLDTHTLPIQGSRSDLAIESAISLLENTGFRKGQIVLITDGISWETNDAAALALSKGYPLSIIAVGTEEGEPIPLENGEYLKDNQGNIVVPGVDLSSLKSAARSGGGRFVEMSVSDRDILSISNQSGVFSQINQQNDSTSNTVDSVHSSLWIDHGPWFALPLLILGLLGFRRGWLLLLCLVIVPINPQTAQAFSWQDLWSRPDQQASKHFQDDAWDQVPENAPSSWRGAADYRLQDYENAIDSYQNDNQDQANTHFNLGNAMAKNSQLEEAVSAYDRALEISPEFDAAIKNKQLIESLLEQQQSENDSQDSESDQDSEQSEQDQSDSDQEQNSENGESQDQSAQESSEDSSSTQNESESEEEQNDSKQSEAESEEEQDSAENSDSDSKESEEQSEKETETAQAEISDQTMDEQQQALQQWLQKVPDNPGGLLRRKFAQQYHQRDKRESRQQW